MHMTLLSVESSSQLDSVLVVLEKRLKSHLLWQRRDLPGQKLRKNNLEMTGSRYVFLMNQCLRYQKKAVNMSGEVQVKNFPPNCIAQTVKHPTPVMVWSVMSAQGTGRLCIVEGMMNQHQYKKVLEQRLIPHLKDWFPNGDFIFMHDGTPCHKALSVCG